VPGTPGGAEGTNLPAVGANALCAGGFTDGSGGGPNTPRLALPKCVPPSLDAPPGTTDDGPRVPVTPFGRGDSGS